MFRRKAASPLNGNLAITTLSGLVAKKCRSSFSELLQLRDIAKMLLF